MYTDAHIHLFDFFTVSGQEPAIDDDMILCASAHDREEFLWQEAFSRRYTGRILLSFGIHPQEPLKNEWGFLEELTHSGRIAAIGECGFEAFNPGFRARMDEQREAWDFQVSLALDSGLPLVVHCRKALDLIFADSKRLKKVRAVAFHGWGGSAREADSLVDRGVNAFFCAGKGLLRGDRSLAETVASLPSERILPETDAPYMQSKGERYSLPSDIRMVAERIAALRGEPLAKVLDSQERNFRSFFSVRP
jgi:TatD DNase family protein